MCLHAFSCTTCDSGYFGRPLNDSQRCQPCECSGNVDPTVKDFCDTDTGQCINCLHNTTGRNCARCADGFYGDAVLQSCKRKEASGVLLFCPWHGKSPELIVQSTLTFLLVSEASGLLSDSCGAQTFCQCPYHSTSVSPGAKTGYRHTRHMIV